MTCEFSLSHYRECLEMMDDPGPLCEPSHRLVLRHDVDLSLEYALELAEAEHERGVRSTYLVMVNNPFYNAFSVESREMMKQMLSWGHEIGLHYDSRVMMVETSARTLSEFLDHPIKTVAVDGLFASPDSSPSVRGFVNPSELPHKYISDSGMHWREGGCMCQWIPKGGRLQILTHPIWWHRDLPWKNLEIWEQRQTKVNLFSAGQTTKGHQNVNYVMESMRKHRLANGYV